MKLLEFVSIKLALFLVSGILVGFYFDVSVFLPLAITCIGLLLLGILFVQKKSRENPFFGIVFGLVTIGIGMFSVSLAQPKNHSDHYSKQDLKVPHSWHLKVREVMKSGSYSDRYIAILKGSDNEKASGRILLSIASDTSSKKLQVDDELVIWGSIKEISAPLNPHQFNYKGYLEGLGIYHQIRLDSHNYFSKEHPSETPYGVAANLRNTINSKLKKANFGTEELGIIQALLLGQRNDISTETYNSYKNAGAVHILAVSGLHIGILLMLLEFLFSPLERLPKGKTIKLVIIVLLLWGFAFLAGLSASVIRAVTMFSFVAYALYLNRPSNTFNILALSMFFILLVFNPMLLFHVGFQMSYAAVFAIVWLYPKLQRFWYPKNLIIRKGWQLLSVSIAAQLGVLPISLYYFHQFPGLFFVSNLLIVPFLGLILGIGIVVIILALVNLLPNFLATVYNSLIHVMNSVIGWVAGQEAFIFKDIPFDKMQLVLSYLVIFFLVFSLTKNSFRRMVFLLLGIIGFQAWSIFIVYTTQQQAKLMVLHQIGNTVLFHQKGAQLTILTTDDTAVEKMATDYKVAENIRKVMYQPLKNSYVLNSQKVLILDSLGIYPPNTLQPDFLLLSQSPRINLERYLDSVRPKTIIADGSNYTTYVNRWKKTCEQKKLPFYYTGEKGAYYFASPGTAKKAVPTSPKER